MKKIKSGFTLSELLLCVGIIAIVSAMGMTIAKQGTEKAYKLYFSTGYMNLYDALAEEGVVTPTGINGQMLAGIFSGAEWNAAQSQITATNGISYTIDNVNHIVTMSVPAQITRANSDGRQSVDLLYDNNNGLLIPIEQNPAPADYTNLQNRLDLLRVYIDNGRVGRVDRNGNPLEQIEYFSYRDAYCNLSGGIDYTPTGYAAPIINCSGFTPIAALANSGVLKFAPPRR